MLGANINSIKLLIINQLRISKKS